MIEMLQSKIHRITVTDANIDYEGSITLSSGLIKQANLIKYQKVLVVDINNGNRFETYVIDSSQNDIVCINGAAARLVNIGDKIIIMSFSLFSEVPPDYKPTTVFFN